ncbi:MAG: alpha/beta hydrolase [Candidatus Limnocylindrales bacterium]
MVSGAERPIRKDEIVLEERGLYVESWLPERRSRRHPLLFVHGELAGSWLWERYLGYFAHRGWEGHALNLRGHFWSDVAELSTVRFEDYVSDVLAACERMPTDPVLVGHGLGALLALSAAQECRVAGLVLVAPASPVPPGVPARPHVLRDVPDTYTRALLGWQSLPEQLRRRNPDLTIEDVLRVQHMLGRESGPVRRAMLSGVLVDRERIGPVPALVIGGGQDRLFPAPACERLADWLHGQYEPFGAHSHYGLIVGSESFGQVAEAIRFFLEAQRL